MPGYNPQYPEQGMCFRAARALLASHFTEYYEEVNLCNELPHDLEDCAEVRGLAGRLARSSNRKLTKADISGTITVPIRLFQQQAIWI